MSVVACEQWVEGVFEEAGAFGIPKMRVHCDRGLCAVMAYRVDPYTLSVSCLLALLNIKQRPNDLNIGGRTQIEPFLKKHAINCL